MVYFKKQITLLLISILSLLLLLYMTYAFPPQYTIGLGGVSISLIVLFFILLFFLIFGLVGYLIKSKLQGTLVSIFFICFLLFRYFQITNWFFLLLLTILFVLLEIIFLKTQ